MTSDAVLAGACFMLGFVVAEIWRLLRRSEREVYMVCDVDNRTIAVFGADFEAKLCSVAGNLGDRFPGPYYVLPIALDPDVVELAGGVLFHRGRTAQLEIDRIDRENAERKRATVDGATVDGEIAAEIARRAAAAGDQILARPAVLRRSIDGGHLHAVAIDTDKHEPAPIPRDPGPCTKFAHHWGAGERTCRCGEATRDGECKFWRVSSRLTDEEISQKLTPERKP